MHFEVKIDEPNLFTKRLLLSLRIVVIISIVIGIVISMSGNWLISISVGLVIFIIQGLKAYRWEKNFITYLGLHENNLTIKYKSELKCLSVSGAIKDFSIKKKKTFSRTATPYLSIYIRGNLIIKQFKNGGWDEALFDKVVEEFDNALNAPVTA